jgi:hypothetical protein
MIYHHAVTAAAARDRIQRLIDEAAAESVGARPKPARRRRLMRWLRLRPVPSYRRSVYSGSSAR